MSSIPNLPAPGFFRRAAIMCYDGLLLLALLMAAALPVVLLIGDSVPAANPLFQLYLLAVVVVFYAGFWLKGGQTLGMKTWRVRLVRADGSPPRLRDAALRLAAALLSWLGLGLGFLWVTIDRDRRAWHDRLSRTRLVLLPKQP